MYSQNGFNGFEWNADKTKLLLVANMFYISFVAVLCDLRLNSCKSQLSKNFL